MIVDRRGDAHWPAGTPDGKGGQYAPRAGWLGQVEARLPAGDPTVFHSNEQAIRAAVDYTDPDTGLSVVVSRVTGQPGYGSRYVFADIHDSDDNIVGQAEFTIHDPTIGDVPSAYVNGLFVQGSADNAEGGDYRRQGFGTRYRHHFEAAFRAAGIRELRLHTILTGGIFWARAGFDFAAPDARDDVIRKAREWLVSHPQWRKQVDELAARDNSTPLEWLMLGWSPHASTWPGRQIMDGSSWDGVKRL